MVADTDLREGGIMKKSATKGLLVTFCKNMLSLIFVKALLFSSVAFGEISKIDEHTVTARSIQLLMEFVSDYISDTTGYCHNGFSFDYSIKK